MTIRIALHADVQVDERGSTSLTDQLAVLSFMAKDCARRGVDLICSGGDTFEHARCSPAERAAVDAYVIEQASVAPFAVPFGNHDNPEDFAALNRLRTLHRVVAASQPCVEILAGVAVAFLPWPSLAALRSWHAARFPGADLGIEEGAELARAMLVDIVRGLGVELAAHDGPRVLLLHGSVGGSLTSTGQPVCGFSMVLGLDDLALSGADLIVAGHIHKPQDLVATRFNGGGIIEQPDGTHSFDADVSDIPVIVPGSTRRRDFGEIEPKRYVVVTFDGRRIVSREDVPLPVPEMIHVSAAWRDDALDLADSGAPPINRVPSGALIRLRYSVPAEAQEAARRTAGCVADAWRASGAALVLIEPAILPTVSARPGAAEIVSATTRPDQFDGLWRTRGEAVSAEDRARLMAKVAAVQGEVAR